MDPRTALRRAAARLALATAVLFLPGAALAQSSASYELREEVLNAGGRPLDAVVSASASFRLSLESIGEPVAVRGLTGTSFRMDGGLVVTYPPPGEVGGLEILADQQTLAWSPEPASTAFDLYSGPLSTLPGTYGACAVARVAGTTWVDPTVPAPGEGLFYLVTGVNRLLEEGTKGRDSSGAVRVNPAPCP